MVRELSGPGQANSHQVRMTYNPCHSFTISYLGKFDSPARAGSRFGDLWHSPAQQRPVAGSADGESLVWQFPRATLSRVLAAARARAIPRRFQGTHRAKARSLKHWPPRSHVEARWTSQSRRVPPGGQDSPSLKCPHRATLARPYPGQRRGGPARPVCRRCDSTRVRSRAPLPCHCCARPCRHVGSSLARLDATFTSHPAISWCGNLLEERCERS